MLKVGDPDRPRHDAETTSSSVQASFDRCLVEGDLAARSRGRRSRSRALGISAAIEVLLLGLVFAAPLVTSVAEPHWTRDVYIPFAPGSPVRSRTNTSHLHPGRSSSPIATVYTSLADAMPAPTRTDDSGEPGVLGVESSSSPGDMAAPALLDLHFSGPNPPAMEGKAPSDKNPLKLSEGVEQAQLISRIEPRYPWLALQARVQGTVRLRAIISRDGTIASLEVVSGHPLLVQAALGAVRQWRYRPTMLDGEPVEVETTISVIFQLHN